jgi:hypothetical protein
MLKKVWIGILLIFMISLAGYAAGQDVPSGKWWYNKKVVQNLNLTQKEIRKLDQLYVKSHRKLIKLKNAVEREQFELDALNSMHCWGKRLLRTPKSANNSSNSKVRAQTWPTSVWGLLSVSGKLLAPSGSSNLRHPIKNGVRFTWPCKPLLKLSWGHRNAFKSSFFKLDFSPFIV